MEKKSVGEGKDGNLGKNEMMIIFWHRVIDFQKMNGLFCLNHHIQDKMCDVTPVTENGRRTESGKLSRFFSGRPETAKLSYFYFTYHVLK